MNNNKQMELESLLRRPLTAEVKESVINYTGEDVKAVYFKQTGNVKVYDNRPSGIVGETVNQVYWIRPLK